MRRIRQCLMDVVTLCVAVIAVIGTVVAVGIMVEVIVPGSAADIVRFVDALG